MIRPLKPESDIDWDDVYTYSQWVAIGLENDSGMGKAFSVFPLTDNYGSYSFYGVAEGFENRITIETLLGALYND